MQRCMVVAHSTALTYKGRAMSLPEVRKELDVDYFVRGSVRRRSNTARVTVELVDAAKGQQVWSDRFDHQLVDLDCVPDEVTM